MNQQQQGQADPKLALQYLGEVASTYAQGLKPVEQAPFVNQVNVCMQVLNERFDAMTEEIERLAAQVAATEAQPKEG